MSDETREALAEYLAPYCGFSKEMRDWPRLARRAAGELADAVLSSGLVVPAAIHKVATDALEAGDACGAVGCRALIERDAALAKLAQVTQWHDEVRQECAELRRVLAGIEDGTNEGDSRG